MLFRIEKVYKTAKKGEVWPKFYRYVKVVVPQIKWLQLKICNYSKYFAFFWYDYNSKPNWKQKITRAFIFLGSCYFFIGATGGSRTPDLSVRSRTLYPTELRTHFYINFASLFVLLPLLTCLNILIHKACICQVFIKKFLIGYWQYAQKVLILAYKRFE